MQVDELKVCSKMAAAQAAHLKHIEPCCNKPASLCVLPSQAPCVPPAHDLYMLQPDSQSH